MVTLTMRPYQGEADLPPLVELLNTCGIEDQIDQKMSVEDLRTSFQAPGVDLSRDLRIWENEAGDIIGYGRFWQPDTPDANDASFWFSVHPQARNQGLEAEMLTWGETRRLENQRPPREPLVLRTSTRSTNCDRIAFLEENGYQVDRQFFDMERSLREPIPTPSVPEGFTLRLFAGEPEAEAWVKMFNQSFIDHWNHHDLTLEYLLYLIRTPDYQPEMDWVMVAPNGELVGFCYSSIDLKDNQKRNCKEGWINVLGTRRGFRRRGIARGLLLNGLQGLQQAGMETAKLGVDTKNPNGALQLYQSVGFTVSHTSLCFVKTLE